MLHIWLGKCKFKYKNTLPFCILHFKLNFAAHMLPYRRTDLKTLELKLLYERKPPNVYVESNRFSIGLSVKLANTLVNSA